MSRIRSRNTGPEIIVRSALHRMGFRFRLHAGGLPGSPDIVLPGRRLAVFVHGCFWHRHTDCKFAYTPKSRIPFWQKKFDSNVERDARTSEELKQLGWKIGLVWECETRDLDALRKKLSRLPGTRRPADR